LKRARDNDGFALVTALVLLTVMMGLGLGLLLLTDSQQKASGREQASESAFNVAEGALNAQISQLSRSWPGTELPPGEPGHIPASCTASTTTTTNGCPDKGSLEVGYPNISPVACSAGVQSDPWGSSTANQWTTYVRDDVTVTEGGKTVVEPYNSAAVKLRPTYDENNDSKVWVRSVGVIQCRLVTIVTLVSQQLVTATFPTNALAGNWFETSNNGNKIIINTQGSASQAGEVSMRCEPGLAESACEQYREGQIKPDTTKTSKPAPSPAIPASELEKLKKVAISKSTYFAKGTCPNSLAAASGEPVYVEGPCTLSYNNGIGNSAASLGFLIIVNGTLELNGKAEFFGTVYAVNAQKSSGIVVELHGTSKLTGSIVIDGSGGIAFGSSGKGGQENENFVYDDKAVEELKTFAGASATRNSFRVLPANQ
jgi:Tfp pilus assembly protein PilX